MKTIQVRDVDTKEPIPGARVAIFMAVLNDLVDEDGLIEIPDEAVGKQAITRVRIPGHKSYQNFGYLHLSRSQIIELEAEKHDKVVEQFKDKSFLKKWLENIFEGGRW